MSDEFDDGFLMIHEGDVVEIDGAGWRRVVEVREEYVLTWAPESGLEEIFMPEKVVGFADRRIADDVDLEGRGNA